MRNTLSPRDKRGTREAHEKRDMTNRKPFRSKELKKDAREHAFVDDDGAWRSPVKTLSHGVGR